MEFEDEGYLRVGILAVEQTPELRTMHYSVNRMLDNFLDRSGDLRAAVLGPPTTAPRGPHTRFGVIVIQKWWNFRTSIDVDALRESFTTW